MEAALLGLAVLACPVGMLAMMGVMWISRRRRSDTAGAAGTDAGETTHV